MDRSLALAILIVGRGAITKCHSPDDPLASSIIIIAEDPEYWDCKALSYWRYKEVPMSKRDLSNHPMTTMSSRIELTFTEPNDRELS